MIQKTAIIIFLFVTLLSQNLLASGPEDTSLQDLETRHLKSISTESGKRYEKQIGSVFHGTSDMMKECLPLQKNLTETLVIYFTVSENGKLAGLASFPENETARCIAKHLQLKDFPYPQEEFVGKLKLSFEK